MKVTITGKYFTKKQCEYLIDLAKWSGHKLMGGRLSRHITVTIHIINEKTYSKSNLYATTEISDDDNRKKPREFIITMTNKFGILRSLIILAHEMVHVKQFAQGELVWCDRRNKELWKGKAIHDTVEYWDFPHEIEAHGREKGLVYQWCDARKLWKEPWYKEVF